MRILTFLPRNRPIIPRILTFFPRKSPEIGRFFRELAPENPREILLFFPRNIRSPVINGHSPRRSPGVGHVVLTKFKIMYPDKFTPLAIQQHVMEAWWKVSSLLISGSGSWPQREALALSLFFFIAENTKNLLYRTRFAPALVKKFELDLQAGLGGKRRDRSHAVEVEEWKKF